MLEKYQTRLNELKRTGRFNTIHLWHEETLARMRARLMDLKGQKNRTRLSSGKHVI